MEWSEVITNPVLQNLPFKIELNKFGKLLMSPASNLHGRVQGRLAATLWNDMPEGEVITECSIETSDGVKVAYVVWASAAFIAEFGYANPSGSLKMTVDTIMILSMHVYIQYSAILVELGF